MNTITDKVRAALDGAGAVLVRQRKHLVYRLPNGRTVVVARTASDRRDEQNTLRDIRRAKEGR